jgi:streptomycin 6-kinase
MLAVDTAAIERAAELAHRWSVSVDESFETPTSVVSYGRRDGRAVVLKVVKRPGDEWRSGQIASAFGGNGFVRVLEYVEGAMLLDRLEPGTPLTTLTCSGSDDDATAIVADVIAAMSPGHAPEWCPTVSDWGGSFARYLAEGDTQIPRTLVMRAATIFTDLCASQRHVRLLHGDLQHYNVLHDRALGWVAIDPKGVVGELECELGASLRNPVERPDIFTDPATIERRLRVLSSRLSLDRERITRWAFAQAVLSLIWGVEDGHAIASDDATFQLIAALESML